MKWLKWSVGGLALLVLSGAIAFAAASVAGIAQAQEPPAEKQTRYDELLAEKLGVSVTALQEARKAARDQILDDAAANGRITPEQAERLKNLEPGELHGRLHRLGDHVRGAFADLFQAVADVLGVSKDDLRSELQAGKSLAEIAAAQGMSEDALIAGLTDKVKAQLDAAVADGRITREQADRILSHLGERLDDFVDRQPKERLRPSDTSARPENRPERGPFRR